MSELTIVTNNVPRDVIEAHELTAVERAKFDYHDWQALDRGEDSASFFRYKGELFDLGEFERCADTRMQGWQGIQTDTFFSGTLVRYCDDNERVVVGRVYS